MAGLGFKDFAVGEVLTSADVDGYLMQQAVMVFADSGARGSALGTATGTAVPLAEGMVSYLSDANVVEVYNGTSWVRVAPMKKIAAFTSSGTWTVPANVTYAIAHMVGGGGGGGGTGGAGSDGGDTSVAFAGGTVTATGGKGGTASATANGWPVAAPNSGNGQRSQASPNVGQDGARVVRADAVTPGASITVTVGAGGNAGTNSTGNGGSGFVWIEYYE